MNLASTGAAPADHVDVGDRRRLDRPGGVIGQVGGCHLIRRLDQYPGHVDGDVADADHRRRRGVKVGIEAQEVGMAVVPADERGGAVNAPLVLAGDVHRAVERRADGQDHGVVDFAQLVQADVTAHRDVAAVPDPHRAMPCVRRTRPLV